MLFKEDESFGKGACFGAASSSHRITDESLIICKVARCNLKKTGYVVKIEIAAFNSLHQSFVEQRTMTEMFKFFKHYNHFFFPTDGFISRFIKKCSVVEFTRNQILFDENCVCDKLYFIMSGEIDLLHKSAAEIPIESKKRSSKPLDKIEQDLNRMDRSYKSAVLWNNRRVPLATLTEGAILGLEFFSFKEQLKYDYCAVIKSSMSKCIVLKTEVRCSQPRVSRHSALTPNSSNSKFETS